MRYLLDQIPACDFCHSQQNPLVTAESRKKGEEGRKKEKCYQHELPIPVAQVYIYCNNKRKTTAY